MTKEEIRKLREMYEQYAVSKVIDLNKLTLKTRIII